MRFEAFQLLSIKRRGLIEPSSASSVAALDRDSMEAVFCPQGLGRSFRPVREIHFKAKESWTVVRRQEH